MAQRARPLGQLKLIPNSNFVQYALEEGFWVRSSSPELKSKFFLWGLCLEAYLTFSNGGSSAVGQNHPFYGDITKGDFGELLLTKYPEAGVK